MNHSHASHFHMIRIDMILLLVSQTRILQGGEIDRNQWSAFGTMFAKSLFTKQRLERSFFKKMTLHSLIHGSNDIIQMQIPRLIPFFKAMSHAGRMYHWKYYLSFLLQTTQGTLSQIFLDSPLICIFFARALDNDGVVTQYIMTGYH